PICGLGTVGQRNWSARYRIVICQRRHYFALKGKQLACDGFRAAGATHDQLVAVNRYRQTSRMRFLQERAHPTHWISSCPLSSATTPQLAVSLPFDHFSSATLGVVVADGKD